MEKRIILLDEIRGFIFVLMAIYHIFFDLEYIFGIHTFMFDYSMYRYVSVIIGFSYIFISGISANLSKNIYKRAGICLAVAMIITLCTYIVSPDLVILFGVLHFLAVAMFCSPFLKKIAKRINPIILIIICILGFIMTFNLQLGYLGLKPKFFIPISYKIRNKKFLFPLGICSDYFMSGDYYPVFPWIFAYTLGVLTGSELLKTHLSKNYYKKHSNILAFCGRHSLILYLTHQVVIVGILVVIFMIIS